MSAGVVHRPVAARGTLAVALLLAATGGLAVLLAGGTVFSSDGSHRGGGSVAQDKGPPAVTPQATSIPDPVAPSASLPSESGEAPDRGSGIQPLVFASDEWCPYVCFESTRSGYLVELARSAFESPARPVFIRRMDWPEALREAALGRVDGVLGAARDESEQLVFPEEAAASRPLALAVRADDAWRFTGPESLAGRRIGVSTGRRLGPPFDNGRIPGDVGAEVMRLEGEQAVRRNLDRLIDGRIAAVIDSAHVLRHALDRGGFTPAVRLIDLGAQPPVHLAFSDTPGGRALARRFDAFVRSPEGARVRARLAADYRAMEPAP